MSVPIDVAKLEAAGFTVERVGGGAKINGVFVRMHEDSLVLAPERSAFHRQINAALGLPAAPEPQLPHVLSPEEFAALKGEAKAWEEGESECWGG